jgi:hypothetical protein
MEDQTIPAADRITLDPIARLNDIVARSTVMLRKGEPVTESVSENGVKVTHIWLMAHGDEAPPMMPRVDVHFMTVGIIPEGDELKDEFVSALSGYPALDRLAGGPSYIELGGELGDQGSALRMIALGSHYGLWQAITPALLGLTGPEADQMAGMGLVMMSGYQP